VAVNCAALSRELVESEFFGYVGGAFSGARPSGSAGKFETADGGTLFLDEIAELSCDAQATLLRVLQEEEFVPVGGARPRPIDVRIIAASNRDIGACLRSGALREDLFHRLDVLAIPLPPLRERGQDTLLLAARFLEDAQAEQGKTGLALAPDVARALGERPWPGNVRELKNVVRRMAALAKGTLLSLDDLPPGPAPAAAFTAGSPAARSEDEEGLAHLLAAVGTARTMTEAASLLGVTRSTLYRQLARHGIKAERVLRQKG
jgi:sigma-54 dependent transcriptional regulator, acetoin dehydrogenase operon transcriptional activator AcoR